MMWKKILTRLLDVTLFLGERGLAFRGDSDQIGHPSNGNFLGILELIGRYDSVLKHHLSRVQESQESHNRLQVHYLSKDIQNEFIECCAQFVTRVTLKERESAKYYSIIVDATPDSSHTEQTVFILRSTPLSPDVNKYQIQERFLAFVDCDKKTGCDIAELIFKTLQDHGIPLSDCRGQGYDNGSNMSGKYNGAQALILKKNPLAVFSPCACHSLNLCGVHAAESCPEVITFFGIVQSLYRIFSASTQRWDILKANIGGSLHRLSETRWSARVDAVKPIAEHLPGMTVAVKQVLLMNLTPETKSELNGILKYITTFDCLVLSTTWLKVLTCINQRSTVLQVRDATIDVEVNNLNSLIADLKLIRNNWDIILAECTAVAENLKIDPTLNICEKRVRKRKQMFDEAPEDVQVQSPEDRFRTSVFYVLIDTVKGNMTTRYDAAKLLDAIFGILWRYLDSDRSGVKSAAAVLYEKYSDDVSAALTEELLHLQSIHRANLGPSCLPPLSLLNTLHEMRLHTIFPNVITLLRIFCTLPVTVAQAERSFSTLARVKNVLRSTMCQDRLSNLGVLSVEARLARNINFDSVIDAFARKKARKAPINTGLGVGVEHNNVTDD